MLTKNNRLDRKTVEKVFKEGRFVGSTNLTLKYMLKNLDKGFKIAFITPKTASKKAVDRNLLRRRGYAIIRKHYNKAIPTSFIGCFVFGKKSMESFGGRKNSTYNPTLNLENEIKNILNKIY